MSRILQIPIGNLASKITTWNPRKDKPTSILQYIDISSIDREQKKIIETKTYLGSNSPSRARQLVREGDILVSTVRPNLNAVAQVPLSLDGATASTGYCVLRSLKNKLSPRYLYHWVQTPTFINAMVLQATGASYPAVTDKIIKASKIPLPPLREQRRIAAILDKAEELRTTRKAALDKLDALLESIFLDMFGDPVTNPKGWEKTTFGKIIADGPKNGLYKSAKYIGEGIAFLDIKGLYRGLSADFSSARRIKVTQSELSKYSLQNGDLLMNRVSKKPEGVGVVVFVEDLQVSCLYESNMMRIRLKRVALPVFITYLLALPQSRQEVQARAKIANQASINQSGVRSIPIILPPLKDQQRFLVLFEKIKEIKMKLLLNKGELNDLFDSLQQRAFRGEL